MPVSFIEYIILNVIFVKQSEKHINANEGAIELQQNDKSKLPISVCETIWVQLDTICNAIRWSRFGYFRFDTSANTTSIRQVIPIDKVFIWSIQQRITTSEKRMLQCQLRKFTR